MYVPSANFNPPPPYDIYCAITGESYAWVEDSEFANLPPHIANGAIEALPNRFFQHPKVSRSGNQIRVTFIPTTPEINTQNERNTQRNPVEPAEGKLTVDKSNRQTGTSTGAGAGGVRVSFSTRR